MHHVFVSYSRTDAEWVMALTERLETAGNATWLDQRDIPMTLPWFEQIGEAIAAADLFLICDSPASRESANCGAEARLAFEAGKRSLEVTVGGDLTRAAIAVARAVDGLDRSDRARTELAALARGWDRGGRERGALISARARRRLQAEIAPQPGVGQLEREFLKASRKRARQRTAISALIAVAAVISTLAALAFDAAVDQYEATNDRVAAASTEALAALRRIADDPYSGLAAAGSRGQTESATDAVVITEALSTGVPEDAFRVPAGAWRFATAEIGSEVAVLDAAGRVFSRGAYERDRRRARPAGRVAAGGGEAGDASPGWSLALAPGGSGVDVLRDGHLWRRVDLPLRPQVLALSPDRRELAAASGGWAVIADLRLGRVRTELSGALGPIRDLAWSNDGGRLWALGERLVVAWDSRDGEVLLNRPGQRFEALLPGAAGTAWAVSGDGALQRFEVDGGRWLETLRVDDEIHAGGGASDGSVAALSGERGLWIVPLDGDPPRLLSLGKCRPGRPAFAGPRTLYLPCINADLLRISVPAMEIERRIRVSPIGVFAVRPLPGSDVVLASDTLSGLFAVRGDGDRDGPGESRTIARGECGGAIKRIAVDPAGQVVAPVGSGTGYIGCVGVGIFEGDNPNDRSAWDFSPLLDDAGSALAEAAAVSRDGEVFAYGYSDGTVILHPTDNLDPDRTVTTVIGEIRDMHATADDDLLVATADGIVQRLPLCGRCLSNRAMAKLARVRLERGVEIGTARRVRSARAGGTGDGDG